jgi:hypothetical protein
MKDEIIKIINKADISDWSRYMFESPASLTDFVNSFMTHSYDSVIHDVVERDRFMGVCLQVVRNDMTDVQRKAACLVIIGIYDQMLRSLLMSEINKLFDLQDPIKIKSRMTELIEMDAKFKKTVDKLKTIQGEVLELDREVKRRSENLNIDIYKATLQYASDRWASEDEKKSIASVVKKIKVKKVTMK